MPVVISYEILRNESSGARFCLLYDPLKWEFIAFEMNIISLRKRIADMEVVYDVTSTHQSVITRVIVQFL